MREKPLASRAVSVLAFAAMERGGTTCTRRGGASSSAGSTTRPPANTVSATRRKTRPTTPRRKAPVRVGDGGLNWSTRKMVLMGGCFLTTLWVVCFGVSAIAMEALFRVTYD